MSQVTRSVRGRPVSKRSDAPAYWISKKQARALERLAEESIIRDVAELVGDDARPVPGSKDVETTLVGELLNLFANAGVELPPTRQSSFGILLTLNPAESALVNDGIDRFMRDAATETLSRDPSLILYSGEPERVMRGIKYLRRGLKIPSEYDALLLLAR
jgi:hypothetical protein